MQQLRIAFIFSRASRATEDQKKFSAQIQAVETQLSAEEIEGPSTSGFEKAEQANSSLLCSLGICQKEGLSRNLLW